MKQNKKNVLFYIAIAFVAVLAVGSGVLAYAVANTINVSGDYNNYESGVKEEAIGAFASPDIYSDVNIYGTLTSGSGVYQATTTAAATYTFTDKDLRGYEYIDIQNGTAASNLAFTLPATSTMMQLLPEVGSSRSWLIHNATGTPTLTIVTGAGMDLVAATTNDDVIDGGEWTRLTCTQIAYRSADNENIMCIVDELTNAD